VRSSQNFLPSSRTARPRGDADTMIEVSRGEKIRKLLILGFAIRVRPEVVFFKIARD
jgi:hypothetical protein